MEPLNKIWQVEIDGKIEEADLETLKDWIETGKVSASTRIRRDSLRWIEISEVNILSRHFEPGTREPGHEKKQFAQPRPTQPIPKKISLTPKKKSIAKPPMPRPPFAARPAFQPPLTEKKTSFKIHLLIMALVASIMSAGWVLYVNKKEWEPNKYGLSAAPENSSPMPEDYVEPSAIAKYKANEELLNSDGLIRKHSTGISAPCPFKTESRVKFRTRRSEFTGGIEGEFREYYQVMDENCLKEKELELAKMREDSAAYREELRTKKVDLQKEIKIEAAKFFAKGFILLFLIFLALNFITSTFSSRRQYNAAHP